MATHIDLSKDADSVTNLKRQATALVAQLRDEGQAVVLTINGKVELMVQDAGSHEMLVELVDRLETIAALREGLQEINAGKGLSLEQVKDEVRRKYGIAL